MCDPRGSNDASLEKNEYFVSAIRRWVSTFHKRTSSFGIRRFNGKEK